MLKKRDANGSEKRRKTSIRSHFAVDFEIPQRISTSSINRMMKQLRTRSSWGAAAPTGFLNCCNQIILARDWNVCNPSVSNVANFFCFLSFFLFISDLNFYHFLVGHFLFSAAAWNFNTLSIISKDSSIIRWRLWDCPEMFEIPIKPELPNTGHRYRLLTSLLLCRLITQRWRNGHE